MKNFLFFLFILISFYTSYAQWEKTSWKSGPILYNIYAVDSIIITHSSFFNNKMKISKDYGKTWKDISKGLPKDTSIRAITVKGNTIFAGGLSMWVSHDLGETWHYKYLDYFKLIGLRHLLVVDGVVVAASEKGIYFSHDDGETWQNRKNNIQSKYIINTIANIKDTIYVTTADSVYKTTDFGISWQSIILPDIVGGRNYDQVPCNGQIILIGTSDDTYVGGTNDLYYSKDGGVTWNTVSNNIIRKVYSYQLQVIDNKFIILKSDGIFLSTDYGDSWVNVKDKLPEKLTRADLDLYIFNDKLYIKTRFELYSTDSNFENWETIIEGENYGPITSIKAIDEKLWVGTSYGNYSATYPDGLFYSTDRGDSWERSGLEGEDVNSIYKIGDTLLVGLNFGIAFSTDEGATWVKRTYEFKDVAGFTPATREITVIKNRVFLRMDQLFYYTDDFGVSWNKYEHETFMGQEVHTLAVDQDKLFVSLWSSILYSADAGDTWTDITSNLPVESFGINAIVADRDEIYIAAQKGVYYTSNLGSTWNAVNNGLDITEFNAPFSLYKTGDLVFVSIYGKGAYFSEDKGNNWKSMTGINTWYFFGGAFASLDGYAYFGGYTEMTPPDGDVVYRAKISDLISAPDEAREYSGITIAPNPAGDFISITDYDAIFGERIEVYTQFGILAFESVVSADRLDVSALPAGVYYLKIRGNVGKFAKI